MAALIVAANCAIATITPGPGGEICRNLLSGESQIFMFPGFS
jgi:hypothetical protein